MQVSITVDVKYCQECPMFRTGRDEMTRICDADVDLKNVEYDNNGNIIIPKECPYNVK